MTSEGTHLLGPGQGRLTVRTGRTGAAARAGHDLVLTVSRWRATMRIDPNQRPLEVSIEADPASLRVEAASGGAAPLSERDRETIETRIEDEILGPQTISFRSETVRGGPRPGTWEADGRLELAGRERPLGLRLTLEADGRVSAEVMVRQSDWGIRPYAALLGALRVADEVTVRFDGRLPSA